MVTYAFFFAKCRESSVRAFRKKTPISVRRCRGGGGGAKAGTDKVRSFVTFLHLWLPLFDILSKSIPRQSIIDFLHDFTLFSKDIHQNRFFPHFITITMRQTTLTFAQLWHWSDSGQGARRRRPEVVVKLSLEKLGQKGEISPHCKHC